MDKKISVQLASVDILSKNIVFIDGITRSGKFWLANFLYQIENMEHVRHDPTMDHLAVASFFKLLDDTVALSLLQSMANRQIFENSIGRNLNLRYADSSSVFKNPDLQKYLQRMIGPDRDPQIVFTELKESKAWFVFLAHDWLSHLRVQFKAFPDMRLIRVERNPVDLVNAWYTKGIGRGRMAFGIRINGTNGSVPWFSFPWIDSFESLCEMDRIILSILTLDRLAKETYHSLSDSQKRQILFVSYEMMAGSPLNVINSIADFLETGVRESVWSFVAEKIFRDRNQSSILTARDVKMRFVRQHASNEIFQQLEKAAADYEKINVNKEVADV